MPVHSLMVVVCRNNMIQNRIDRQADLRILQNFPSVTRGLLRQQRQQGRQEVKVRFSVERLKKSGKWISLEGKSAKGLGAYAPECPGS